jgi:tryptophan synthase alpha subunit
MSRIAATFDALRAQRRTALIPYITVGDPFADATPDIMHGLVQGGADVIELGVPFSDPMADGPVIQQASERALARGIGMAQVLDAVRCFRRDDTRTPVVLMGYANPVERYDQRHGGGAFVAAAAAAGVDGVLVVDYPPEECEAFAAALRGHGLDPIFLLAPTSTEQRMREVGRLQRLCLLRVAEGRDRRRPPRHRRRGGGRATHPPAGDAAGGGGIRHPRRRRRVRGGAGGRRGGHRHPAGAIAAGRAARQCGERRS